MSKIKIAIIGFGRQGRQHYSSLREYGKNNTIEIVAVCDVRKTIEKDLEDIFFFDYRKALKVTQPNLVIIAVPNNQHFEITMAALRVGADVLKEKPLALTYAEGKKILLAAKHKNKLVITAQQRYYIPLFLKAREILGNLGKPLTFSYAFTLNDNEQSWYWDLEKAGGGSWLNIGWHGLTTIQWLLGEIESINLSWNRGGKRPWHYMTDHTSFAKVSLKNGAKGSVFFSCIYPKEEYLKITCSKGDLYLSRDELKVVTTKGVQVFSDRKKGNPYIEQWKSVFKNVADRNYSSQFDLDILRVIDQGHLLMKERYQ